MSKDFFELGRFYGGLSLEYSAIAEADFISASGSAYIPPERGNFRRINVSRSIQLLQDATGVIETFQTSTAEIRLPANTLSDSTNDAGNGRLFFLKNSGTSYIVIKDYLGTSLWTVQQYGIIIVVGNDNNNWDFYFTSKNIDFSDPSFVATNIHDAILELSSTAAVTVSPGFTWGYKGQVTPGTYLENDGVPSNVVGRIVPLVSGYITEIFISNELTTTFSIDIQKRSGATYTTITTVTVISARNNVFSVNLAVVRNDELCIRVSPSSANSAKNLDIGLIIKGSV